MKIIAIMTLCLAGFALSLHAQFDAGEVVLSLLTTQGKTTVHKISQASADSLPKWNPESGKPAPLSLDAAIKKGKEWMKKKNPKMDDFQLRSIQISQVGFGSIPDCWFYTLEFDPVLGDQRLHGLFRAIVLMDGTVIEPIVRDATKR